MTAGNAWISSKFTKEEKTAVRGKLVGETVLGKAVKGKRYI